MIRKICILVAVLLSIAQPVSVIAATAGEIQPLYEDIATLQASLTIDTATGRSSVIGRITAKVLTPVRTNCSLQQYKNGGWVELKSWSATGNMVSTVSSTYYVAPGYNYRVVVTGYILDGQGNVTESDSAVDVEYYPAK